MPLLRRGHVLAALCFVWALCLNPARAESGLHPLWGKAVQAFQSGHYSEAAPLLEEWTVQARREGTLSAEAYYNLALSYWHLKQAGRAVYYLAWSASLQSAPWNAWRTLALLDSIQANLGIRDSVSDDPTFRLFLLLNRNTIWALTCLGAWLLVASVLLRLRHGRHRLAQAALWSTASVFLVLGFVGMLNRSYFARFGVLQDGEATKIAVFRTADTKPENKLIDLPPGTLVKIAAGENTMAQVSEPVAGWVLVSQIGELPLRTEAEAPNP